MCYCLLSEVGKAQLLSLCNCLSCVSLLCYILDFVEVAPQTNVSLKVIALRFQIFVVSSFILFDQLNSVSFQS